MTAPRASDSDERQWYKLFSRGARDWLRHNEKVREAVRQHLPRLAADLDLSGGVSGRTVQVPVRFLEHYRFTLRPDAEEDGVGQGNGPEAGQILRPGDGGQGRGERGQGSGEGEGEPQFLLELKVDDIVDWLWEEMNLPNLRAKSGRMEDDEFTREGWDKRGARARLDRRRTLKEAIKRRAAHGEDAPPFTNDDLRYRQLVRHQRPTTEAAVILAMDVSSSMTDRDRKLAKSFFFWALQGLRRQYQHIETAFVAHTVRAWEFNEAEFFQVSAQGGTVASSGFEKVREIIDERFDPARYNIYLFYASDGENFPEDRGPARKSLEGIVADANFCGYLETLAPGLSSAKTNTWRLFTDLANEGRPVGAFPLGVEDDVWSAIRGFFQHQAGEVLP